MAVVGKQPGKQPRDTGEGWQNNTTFFFGRICMKLIRV